MWEGRIERKLDEIIRLLTIVLQQERKFMSATDDAIAKLIADVSAENTELASLETLAAGLKSSLDAAIAAAANAGATAAQLQSLSDLSATVEAQTTAIHAAVLTNTPSAAQAPPTPAAAPAAPAPDAPPAA